jgi:cytochrome c-type biogenesis protein CcmH
VTRALRPFSSAVLVALALATAVTAQPDRPTQSEIEESLTCQCGCGLTVHSCNHIQCGSGEPIKKEIGERLARGETKEQILGAFRQKFGEKVLSSPTLEGFNWLAWVTPFAGLLVAGTVLTIAIRRRTRGGGAGRPPSPPAAGSPPVTEEHRARLARELAEFDRDA